MYLTVHFVLTFLVLSKCDISSISRVQYSEDCIQIGAVEQIWPFNTTLLRNLQLSQLLNKKLSGILLNKE